MTKDRINVWNAVKADIEGIYSLMKGEFFNKYGNGKILPVTMNEIEENINNGNQFVAKAGWNDGEIVGSVFLKEYGNKMLEIRGLVVHPDYKSKGIGKMLYGACVSRAYEIGGDYLYAFTKPELINFFKSDDARDHLVELADVPEAKLMEDCKKCLLYGKACNEVTIRIDLSYNPGFMFG